VDARKVQNNFLSRQFTWADICMSDQLAVVDVIIAVWNSSGTIERAVRSALSEPDVNCIIVVDDRSTDDTSHIVSSLVDEVGDRIRLERLDRNAGPAVARNRGMALSKAPWIAILDGDDYFRPGRVRALLDASQGADFVADDHIQIREGEDVNSTPAGPFLLGIEEPITLDLETFVAGNISQKGRLRKEFGFLKPIMRRSFLERHQLRYKEVLRLGEDFALYARALAVGAVFKVIPSRAYVSIVRSGSISGNHTKRDLELLRDSDIELQGLPTLTEREKELIQLHYESIDARVQWLNVIDAVKARSLTAFLSPFFIRSTTSVYLIGCLLEQLFLRSKKLMGS
jgi:succinoglycan biosynthesis protein ExoU